MVVLTIPEFIGHLHPVLVHLPIGVLLIACVFILLVRKEKFAFLESSINLIVFWGMVSAILSCITGYVLSQSSDYDEDLVGLHQWMGISVAALAIGLYLARTLPLYKRWSLPLALTLLVCLVITGHLGGSLTHGPDYLTKPLQTLGTGDPLPQKKHVVIPDIQKAVAYSAIVQPILESNCYSCHGSNKQKGKLRLDKIPSILQGGKDGAVLVAGNPASSELIKRMQLPREDDHHMPPREKSPLSEKEIALIEWWVAAGADFSKRVQDIRQPDAIKPLLLSLQYDTISSVLHPDAGVPSASVGEASPAAIQKLQKLGVAVLPVGRNTHYLSADFISAPGFNERDIRLLSPVKEQLVWLKMSNTQISDSSLVVIGQCTHLSTLELAHTSITDKGMAYLQSLHDLQKLNIVGTALTAEGLLQLKGLTKLHLIYLYESMVAKKDWKRLQQAFPEAELDSGGYTTTFLPSDTVVLKKPRIAP